MASKRGRKRKNDLYFGPEQEKAVAEYLSIGVNIELERADGKPYYIWSGSTKEQRRRDKLYLDYLYEPLNKMVESIIRKYKLYRKKHVFEDLHSDALSFLITKAHKFDVDTGKRAYSYYGTIIKNYLLGHVQKDVVEEGRFSSYEENFDGLNNSERLSYNLDLGDDALTQLIMDVVNKIEKELTADEDSGFKKLNENQRRVGHGLVEILLNWDIILDDTISNNKKYDKLAIYETMRNLTGLETKDMRKALSHYKDIYYIFKDDYIENDLL